MKGYVLADEEGGRVYGVVGGGDGFWAERCSSKDPTGSRECYQYEAPYPLITSPQRPSAVPMRTINLDTYIPSVYYFII